MTHMEAMAAIAQGVINIDAAACGDQGETGDALNLIEKDSRIYRGMLAICAEETRTNAALGEIERILSGDVTHGSRVAAIKIVRRMIAERTDPEFTDG